MLKILQARLQQYTNRELPDVQAGFKKGRGTRDQIANIRWIIEKARGFQKKTSISALLTMPKPLTVWITTNYGKKGYVVLVTHKFKHILGIIVSKIFSQQTAFVLIMQSTQL